MHRSPRHVISGLPFSIVRLSEADSTNRLLKDWGRDSPEDNLVVVADYQTDGRGRLGRRWESPRGEGLYFSLLHAPVAMSAAGCIPLMAGLVLYDALAQCYPALQSLLDLKWPNDLLLNGKKAAGILTELENSSQGDSFVLIGIGVNCSQLFFPPEIPEASSLQLELGHPVNRDFVLEAFLAGWHRYRLAGGRGPEAPAPAQEPETGRWPPVEEVVEGWKRRSRFWKQQRVRFSLGGEVLEGVTCDVAPSGALVVQLEAGGRQQIFSGQVDWIRSTAARR
ncbi:MAG: biotin--[acetyl-CoA-carboxylase] ligase [Acidobacteria bacterium]|nr:biotin--[acetyl-CoA-carboxylase] ligase [Acidobacteriota bacterium]